MIFLKQTLDQLGTITFYSHKQINPYLQAQLELPLEPFIACFAHAFSAKTQEKTFHFYVN